MARRPENTAVDIDHQPVIAPEVAEHLMEIRTLSDVPQRLGLMHGDDAVVLRRIAVPGPAVIQIGMDEGRNVARRILGEMPRNDVPDGQVTVRLEMFAVLVPDPSMDWRRHLTTILPEVGNQRRQC